MDQPLSELFVSIADYCGRHDIKGPGYIEFDGPQGLKCKLNATPAKHDRIGPYACLVIAADGMPVREFNPYGGIIVPISGWSEDKLIEAFKEGVG